MVGIPELRTEYSKRRPDLRFVLRRRAAYCCCPRRQQGKEFLNGQQESAFLQFPAAKTRHDEVAAHMYLQSMLDHARGDARRRQETPARLAAAAIGSV